VVDASETKRARKETGIRRSGISACDQPARRGLVIATFARGDVPVHAVGQPVVDVEEEGDLERVLDGALRDTGVERAGGRRRA
jgi:hypothetical protein